MKRLLLIAVAVLAGFSIMTLLPERETYEPATDLREAMQERYDRYAADSRCAGRWSYTGAQTADPGLPVCLTLSTWMT